LYQPVYETGPDARTYPGQGQLDGHPFGRCDTGAVFEHNMKLNQFAADRQEGWQRLEALLKAAGRRAERLGPEGVWELASLYRSVAADLATARRQFPGDPVVVRLEALVGAARPLIYERAHRRGNLLSFFADGYWIVLWERRRPLALAAALLLVPASLGAAWASVDPETVSSLVPVDFLWVVEADTTDTGLSTVGLAGFSTFVLTNNIRVTLAAFALGMTWGVGTGWMVANNGLILGQVAGLAVGAGNSDLLAAALMAHGVLELTCMVVAGAAGISLGQSMLRPGKKTRRRALADESIVAFKIAGGTACWLVLAGFIEGFASRQGFTWIPTTIFGLAVGGLFWGLLLWRGAGQNRAVALARR
jgi:uncharacterized membrane protein SpoIIM required for sporulation